MSVWKYTERSVQPLEETTARKNSASGRRHCVWTLHTHPKRLDARDETWQGSLTPEDTSQRTCHSRREPPMYMRTRWR